MRDEYQGLTPIFSEPLLHVFSGAYEALPSWQCYEDLVMRITKLELVIGTVPAWLLVVLLV